MKCRLFRDLLDEYMDNELSEIRREAMDAHAADCHECRELLQERKRLFHRLTSTLEPDWDVNLADTVMAEIRTMPLPQASNPLRRPLIAAVTTAVVISGLLMLIGLFTLPESVSPVDVMKLLAGSIDMPPGLRASVSELGAFLSACWVIVRVMLQIIVQIGTLLLFKIPVTIPLLMVFGAVGVGVWWFRRRSRGSMINMMM